MRGRSEARKLVASDRIYETIVLRTSRGRAWLAISDAREFGAWFGAVLEGPFAEGATVRGRFARPAVAGEFSALEPYFGKPIELVVTCIDAARRVSFVWHPHAVDPEVDYSDEAPTEVSLEIEDDPEGVVLTMTESGFNSLPLARRTAALVASERGWEQRMLLVKRRVEDRRFGTTAPSRPRLTESRPARQ